MTSKEKAIEAFGRIKDVYRTHTINLQDVVDVQNQLNKPTLDDAIKVVEDELKRLNSLTDIDITFETYHKKYDEAYLIYTALKGLKEGK